MTIPHKQWMGVAGAVLFTAAALQQAGIQYTTAGNAGFITRLSVIIVPFVLLVGWRERPSWVAGAAAVMAGMGANLLSIGGTFEFRRGDVLELARALFWHCIWSSWECSRFASRLFLSRFDNFW